MHSGMLFLFPHILKVVYSAEKCRTVDFETRHNMWFNPEMPQTQLTFDCVYPWLGLDCDCDML